MAHIVFIPGMLCDERLWRSQREYFATNHHVKIVDISSKHNICGFANQVINEFSRETSEQKMVLVGLSMGGYIAMEVMKLFPEKVSHLALIATSAGKDSAERIKYRRDTIKFAKMGKFKGITPKMIHNIIHERFPIDSEMAKLIMQMAEDSGVETFICQQKAVIAREMQYHTLQKITCPVSVISGDSDNLTPPKKAHKIYDHLISTEQKSLHILDECGHLPPLEEPDKVNALLEELISF